MSSDHLPKVEPLPKVDTIPGSNQASGAVDSDSEGRACRHVAKGVALRSREVDLRRLPGIRHSDTHGEALPKPDKTVKAISRSEIERSVGYCRDIPGLIAAVAERRGNISTGLRTFT